MVNLHPVPGKQKSSMICQAFAAGAPMTAEGHVFYGVNEMNNAAWQRIRRGGEPWYYIDNSYFDRTRGTHFRVTKNAIQCHDKYESTGVRLRDAFGSRDPEMKRWRSFEQGHHIVVCPQSDVFMKMIADYCGNWLKDTLELCNSTWPSSPVVVRVWSSNKMDLAKTLVSDLENAARLVTHTSAAAVTALIEGVQPLVDRMHALAGWPIHESGDGRLQALCVLADNQWTLDEMRAGKAWAWLNR